MATTLPETVDELYAPHVELTPRNKNKGPVETRIAFCSAPNHRDADLQTADDQFGDVVVAANRDFHAAMIEMALTKK